MQKVVFDSSFLIAVMEHPTTWYEDIQDLVGGFEPVILGSVESELERLAKKEDKTARFAALARDLADGMGKVGTHGKTSADDDIISYAIGEGAAVATIDSGLIGQLKASRSRVITLGKGRVMLG